MGIHFNADEVFAMAVKIEENGAAFYRRAGELHKGSPHAGMLDALARMEDAHKKIFEDMRRTVPESYKAEQSFDPYNEAAMYLAAMGDSHGGEGSPAAADRLTGRETFTDILDIALELEQTSILYYLGLRDLVPERLGRDKIDVIIGEEKKHVIQLQTVKSQQ